MFSNWDQTTQQAKTVEGLRRRCPFEGPLILVLFFIVALQLNNEVSSEETFLKFCLNAPPNIYFCSLDPLKH